MTRACIQTQKSSIFQKFLATFLQNFAAVFNIPQKILQKNEQKFVEKRRFLSLNTGSSSQQGSTKLENVYVAMDSVVFKGFSFVDASLYYNKDQYSKFFDKVNFFRRNYLRCKTIHLKKAILITNAWSFINYYHWLCEAMMNLAANNNQISQDHVLIFPYSRHSMKEELFLQSLAPFGIDKSRIVRLGRYEKAKVGELISFSMQDYRGGFRSDLIDLVREKVTSFYSKELTGKFGEKIYISRSKALYRKIENEQEVAEMLKRHGFSTVRMEEHSFIEQVDIAHNAKVLLTSHGAALANIVFIKKNSLAVELINKNMNHPVYEMLAQAANVRYFAHDSKPVKTNIESPSDIKIDVENLERDLNSLTNSNSNFVQI